MYLVCVVCFMHEHKTETTEFLYPVIKITNEIKQIKGKLLVMAYNQDISKVIKVHP